MEKRYKLYMQIGDMPQERCGVLDSFERAQVAMAQKAKELFTFEGKVKADWEALLSELPEEIREILRGYEADGVADYYEDLEGDTANYSYKLEDGQLEIISLPKRAAGISVWSILISPVGLSEDDFNLDATVSVQWNQNYTGYTLEEDYID